MTIHPLPEPSLLGDSLSAQHLDRDHVGLLREGARGGSVFLGILIKTVPRFRHDDGSVARNVLPSMQLRIEVPATHGAHRAE